MGPNDAPEDQLRPESPQHPWAYSPDDRDLISMEGRESCDAERVVQLLHKIRAANPGKHLLG